MTPVHARLVSVEGEVMKVKLLNGFILTLPFKEEVTYGDHLLVYYDLKAPEKSVVITRRWATQIDDAEVREIIMDEFDEHCIFGMDEEGRGMEPEALNPEETTSRCMATNAGAITNTEPRGSHPRKVYVRYARCGDQQRGGDKRRSRKTRAKVGHM